MLIDAPLPRVSVARSQWADQAAERPASMRAIERLTLVMFWLLIMEGTLRKWVAPGLSHLLFFVRDPFVILLYWHALRGRVLQRPDPLLIVGLCFAVIAPFLAVAQIAQIGDSRM